MGDLKGEIVQTTFSLDKTNFVRYHPTDALTNRVQPCDRYVFKAAINESVNLICGLSKLTIKHAIAHRYLLAQPLVDQSRAVRFIIPKLRSSASKGCIL